MLIGIYELAYCCFLCNTVVECCFNGLVILGLYGLPKSLRAICSVRYNNFIAINCRYTTYPEKLVVGFPSEHFTVRFNH